MSEIDIEQWQKRWDARQIGFHEGKPNDLLVSHANTLAGCKRVLVPLAGKAKDLVFLASLGLEVVGVEAVESACREFFDDNGIPLVIEQRDRFRAFCGGGVTLLCGDIFDATPERLGSFDALYDRAALVALPPTTRARYLTTIAALLQPKALLLLLVFHYDQTKLDGPPWSIDPALARTLYAGFTLEELVTREIARGAKFLEAGVDKVEESLLVMRAP